MIRLFVEKDESFRTFKSAPLYAFIIGAPDSLQARGFYELLKQDKELFDKLPELAKADEVGSPQRFKFGNLGLSLNTLRYANSIQILRKEGFDLTGKSILEFGSGWGGLYYAINCVWKPKGYAMLDIPEAMDLTVKHSIALGISPPFIGPLDNAYLFVAEYSLTEIVGQDLYDYTDAYAMTAQNLFIRCNIMNQDKRDEFVDHLKTKFEIQMFAEQPRGVPYNFIVIGRRK